MGLMSKSLLSIFLQNSSNRDGKVKGPKGPFVGVYPWLTKKWFTLTDLLTLDNFFKNIMYAYLQNMCDHIDLVHAGTDLPEFYPAYL